MVSVLDDDGEYDEFSPGFDPDFANLPRHDPDDRAASATLLQPARGGLRVYAPPGPQEPHPGFAVWAVEMGEGGDAGEWVRAQEITTVSREFVARTIAGVYALQSHLLKDCDWATHVEVNDGDGNVRHRVPIMRAV